MKPYLTQLLDDIKRLGEELGGPHAGVKEDPGECAPEGNPCKQASSRGSVMPPLGALPTVVGKRKKGRLPLWLSGLVGSSVKW